MQTGYASGIALGEEQVPAPRLSLAQPLGGTPRGPP
jgi:hypothetical protein